MLGLVGAATAVTCTTARFRPGRWLNPFTRVLAVSLVVSEMSWWAYAALNRLPLSVALPLQLCDVAPLVAAVALWWRWVPAAELAYFWGLGGSTQALLTPDLPDVFPSFLFVQYVVEHGLTVLAALLLPIGLDLHPRSGALPRTIVATVALAAVAALADLLTGGDYMFLARPPASATVLSLFGPWPWYLIWAAALSLVLIALLGLPFRGVTPRRWERSVVRWFGHDRIRGT